WTSTCLNTHERCSIPDENFVPTRLIDISHQQGHRVLRLIKSGAGTQDGYKDPYCALSYCWGGEQLMATTKKTLQRYLTRLNMEDLPQSIRDAILVTEKLGMRRLWVDSLCIIQDDVADKAREIAQMPQVYGNATVTIAASRGSGVEEGFLQERPILGLEKPNAVFELPYRNHAGGLGSIIVVPRPIVPKIEFQPLDLRAWALQERLLPPRVLDFARSQTSWFCQTNSLAKEIPTDGFQARTISHEGAPNSNLAIASVFMLGQGNRTLSTPLPNRNAILESWQAVVYAYSGRALTQSTDRPLAISGIATRFAKLLQSNYHAGLWEFALASELLWYEPGPRLGRKLKPRPQTYQGPSWSWFCINDTV
ncbi:HET-domain-containing protein, partial [Stipitochalara longipes BDJ]